MHTFGNANENALATYLLAEIFLGVPCSPQRLAGIRFVSPEVFPMLAQRRDGPVFVRLADPQLAQKGTGSAIDSLKTSDSGSHESAGA
jgi:hypothetical protein